MKKEKYILLKQHLDALCEETYLTHTRIHRLRTWRQKSAEVYTKREDETGFGLSGSKKRKYASLIPFIENSNYQGVVLIGGARSNHIMSLLQLLNERGIKAYLFLKSAYQKNSHYGGNEFLRRLLTDESNIQWVEGNDWPEVETLAENFISKSSENLLLIPEGGSCEAAFPGACSLLLDISENESEHEIQFDHIWIDSGTALMAGSLCLMNAYFQRDTKIHVVMNAGDEAFFINQLEKQRVWLSQLLGDQSHSIHKLPIPTLYFPSTAKAFGGVNRTILTYIKKMAQDEGLLLDPIYTAKLFYTAQQHIENQIGNVLIIHSGGGTGLMGFNQMF